MQKNKFIILSLLLLLVPACGKKRICPIHPAQPYEVAPIVDPVAPCQNQADVAPFALESGENPFTSNNTQAQDFALVDNEQLQDSSSKYGLKTVYFDFDSYNIKPDQKTILGHNANIAKDLVDQGHNISIEGHACNFAGDTQYNMALSEDRAKSVAQFLAKNGIDESRISTVGYGSTRPLVPSGDKEQQAPNRRVEIHAYKK